MLPQEIIRKKRDGGVLSDAEIAAFVSGLTDGGFSDAQISAFAMAVFFKGMTLDERVALTAAMTRSGAVLDWRDLDLDGPVVDKHSTGGVGDVVSLMLAPALAAMGAYVPMISGRGLGHTGGTLDKLESIPGYTTQPDDALFRRVVKDVGCAIIGQTAALAPADKRFYAIRDVTATVESIDLITASILSKKLAAGVDALVLDVKTGSGAFMPERADCEALAKSLVGVGNGAGMNTAALLTAMDQPLAPAAGNALEVHEAIAYLTGARRDPQLHAVTRGLAIEMALLGGLVEDSDSAAKHYEAVLASGAAAERFAAMVTALGGPADLMDDPSRHLAEAPVIRAVEGSGPVTAIDTRALGVAVVTLGGGRRKTDDLIDPAVGLSDIIRIGENATERPLCTLHAASEEAWRAAAEIVRGAIHTEGEAAPYPAILGRIDKKDA